MTEAGRVIFYKANPEEQDKAAFNKSCPDSATYAELGCYYRGRIFYLKITDPTYADQTTITAAHEMLHAAYNKLGIAERENVDRLVLADFNRLQDADLKKTMTSYTKMPDFNEAARLDELHSFMGTQLGDLSPELETYYAQYFTDRAALVAIYKTARIAEKKIEAELDALDASIALHKQQIKAMETRLQQLADAGSAAAYHKLYAEYTALIATTNAEVDRYNAKAAEFNKRNDARDSTKVDAAAGAL